MARPVKLLVVMPFANEFGGLEQLTVDLVRRGLDRGWHVTVVSPCDVPEASWFRRSLGHAPRWVPARPGPVRNTRGERWSERWFWRSRGRRLVRDADVVHLLGNPKHFVCEAVLAAARTSTPAIYTEIARVDAALAKGSLTGGFRAVCNELGALNVFSSSQALAVREHFGYRGRICVVDQWLEATLEEALLAIPRPRQATDGVVTLGALSRLSPEKGVAWLVEAYAVLRSTTSIPTRLVIGGAGPEEAALRSAVTAAGLDDCVDFTGFVSDRRAFLEAVDVFVLSSNGEGGPIGAVEAMAAGCAIVSTRVGAMEDRLQGTVDGRLVTVGDTAELVAALEVLVERVHAGALTDDVRGRFLERNAQAVLLPAMDEIWDSLLG
ncbi:MAG: glycosyl transferase, group 1 [Ilumatobacteraceae bacterium]|nr:glycosyl transferase, group 1 [Ilumatobacteraceae bacterium]